ncbi:ABC-three component system middle component 2 [Paenibacillus xylanexedens]|uniref:ABC-three component system middle component 2 n=1 Tax=Paenibacillus xylanexedens TaxID=528191 RepID=UPI003D060CD6
MTRILILLSKFGSQKTIKISLDKIMLLDFYMKYPNVMIEDENLKQNLSFYDYYSYYHWKPNREEYHVFLRLLTAKKLVSRNIIKSEFIYQITSDGTDVIESLNSSYYKKLDNVANYIKKNIARLSDTKIEEDIILKSFSCADN